MVNVDEQAILRVPFSHYIRCPIDIDWQCTSPRVFGACPVPPPTQHRHPEAK
jgi:hypothetical protein